VKGWLSRAVAHTVAVGKDSRNRVARWVRWFPVALAVDQERFQGPAEAYPRHWRRFPDPWPPMDPSAPEAEAALREALDELPVRWRELVLRRDVRGVSPRDTARELGLSAAQERAIVNQAHARLRERLARLLTGTDRS
jgi:RNA polymerase sigma-70 factor (ECF subfamily)